MNRFYYEFREMADDSWEYCVFDRRRGSDSYLAICATVSDAEKIVDALNAVKPPAPDVFA